MPKTNRPYLSLDVDFWNHRSLVEFRKVMGTVKKLQDKGKSLLIVDRHHKLVPHANKFGCRKVVNVDFHSDIVNSDAQHQCDGTKLKLNCGTWANFLNVREQFVWMYPATRHRMQDALCHWPQTPKYSPFKHPEVADWKEARKEAIKATDFPYDVLYGNAAIGIAISYEYLPYGERRIVLLRELMDIFGEKALPKTFNDFGSTYRRGTVVNAIQNSRGKKVVDSKTKLW